MCFGKAICLGRIRETPIPNQIGSLLYTIGPGLSERPATWTALLIPRSKACRLAIISISPAPVPTSEHHFTGKERDIESNLDYFPARYYNSNLGRFLSPDPSGLYYADPTNPQSLNLYSYARNNPLKNTDPTGLDCVWG